MLDLMPTKQESVILNTFITQMLYTNLLTVYTTTLMILTKISDDYGTKISLEV